MSEQTEHRQMVKLIRRYGVLCGDWAIEPYSDKTRLEMVAVEDDILNRIRSIISERDALRAAMKSHRKELR